MNKTLYFKYLKYGDFEDRARELNEVIEALHVRPFLVDRLLGSVRGMHDGKYKHTTQELIEHVVDNLLSNGLIDVDAVSPIFITQIK